MTRPNSDWTSVNVRRSDYPIIRRLAKLMAEDRGRFVSLNDAMTEACVRYTITIQKRLGNKKALDRARLELLEDSE
mgnify:CR=1 FL=1